MTTDSVFTIKKSKKQLKNKENERLQLPTPPDWQITLHQCCYEYSDYSWQHCFVQAHKWSLWSSLKSNIDCDPTWCCHCYWQSLAVEETADHFVTKYHWGEKRDSSGYQRKYHNVDFMLPSGDKQCPGCRTKNSVPVKVSLFVAH